MATHSAIVSWSRNGATFTDQAYSRAHEWSFDGGAVVPASSSPHIVALPYSDPTAVDPEEAFIAALSSCHMLFFLSIAAAAGFVVDRYDDDVEGRLAPNAEGKLAMTVVSLRPHVTFGGERVPIGDEVHAMHHRAHEQCFLANSVRCKIECTPVGV